MPSRALKARAEPPRSSRSTRGLPPLARWAAFGLAATVLLSSGCARWTLHTAIARGKEDRAIQLAQKQKGLEERNQAGATPLHEAVARNQVAVVAALVEAGADVNAQMPDGQTPLFFVGRHADPQTLAILIDGGADVNAELHSGITVLCSMFQNVLDDESYQRRAEIASSLIAAGAAPDTGAHSFTLPPPTYVWGVYFLACRAAGADDAFAAESFNSARELFDRHAQQQRARHEELTERAKGVAGRNIGRGVGSFLVGVATGVATLGLVTVVPNPAYESRRAIRAQAEQARQLSDLYEQTSRDCQQRLDALSTQAPGQTLRPRARLPFPAASSCPPRRAA